MGSLVTNGFSASPWLLSEWQNSGMIPVDFTSSMAADRILVVDDEDAIREIVSSMLSYANYQCRQAASGKEALALLD